MVYNEFLSLWNFIIHLPPEKNSLIDLWSCLKKVFFPLTFIHNFNNLWSSGQGQCPDIMKFSWFRTTNSCWNTLMDWFHFSHFSQKKFKTILKTASFAQVSSSVEVYGKVNLDIEPINDDQSTAFWKMFDLIWKTEEVTEAYRTKFSDLFDRQILKNFLHQYHAEYFSRVYSNLSLKTMQHSSTKLESAVNILRQVLTKNLFWNNWHQDFFNFEKIYHK